MHTHFQNVKNKVQVLELPILDKVIKKKARTSNP